jgi:hypothetical protein
MREKPLLWENGAVVGEFWQSREATKDLNYADVNSNTFRDCLYGAIDHWLQSYLWLLSTVVNFQDFAGAREAVDLMMNVQVTPFLKDTARIFWDCRARLRLQDLDGLAYSFKIRNIKRGDPRRGKLGTDSDSD